ncbi:hypothetical protein PENANT_c021G07852 [Penicillium antarcticum]|uniref:Uncharacterized protein n=1 Tax=Penicillium antarcticum TaxID=416450 RepID=A0A1V6Q0F5_9EURO|nr:hypothetical protein PENANT_c021G07852 [Penicillium antarcticum]
MVDHHDGIPAKKSYVWITVNHLLRPGTDEVAFRGQSRIANDQLLGSAFDQVRIIHALKTMPPAYVSDLLQPSSSLRLLGKGQPQTVKGKFRFSAWEPNPVSFLSSSYGASNGSLTILSVNMEFQLTHDEPLPTINRISRKLLAQTATHTVPFRESSAGPVCKSKKKAETHSVRLSDLKLSPVQWVQHGLATVIGRETQALVARAEDCGNGSKNCIDTATIEVPIMSPQHESLAPENPAAGEPLSSLAP